MKKYLVKFDFGLYNAFGASLEVLTEEDFKKVIDFSASGETVYLGEIEGKHSEIYGPLDREDFSVITEDQDFIDSFQKKLGSSFGAFDMLESINRSLSEEA